MGFAMPRLLLAVIATFVFTGSLLAQEKFIKLSGESTEKVLADVGTVDIKVVPDKAKPGQLVKVLLTVTPKNGAWTYPANPPAGQFALNTIDPPRRGTLIFVGAVNDPKDWVEKASGIPGKKDRVYKHAVTWELQAVVSPKETPGTKSVILKGVTVQICKTKCYDTDNDKNPLTANFEVLPGPAESVPQEFAADVAQAVDEASSATPKQPIQKLETAEQANKSAGIIAKMHVPIEEYEAGLKVITPTPEATESTTEPTTSSEIIPVKLLLTAAFWGLVSLATPCVFPMIPITVSLFLKQSNQSPREAAKLAGVYCLTIIAILGIAAGLLISVFQFLSVHPAMNIFLGGLFVFFAIGLFGLYEVTLGKVLVLTILGGCIAAAYGLIWFGLSPWTSFAIMTFTFLILMFLFQRFSKTEGRFLQFAERQRSGGGMIGVIFGAITFAIVSFTCVAPFLGGFAGLVASNQYSPFQIGLAGLTFATAFALPFFFLALFPSLLKMLPKSGGWMDRVKAVMGFLELAAAMKFLRTAELRLTNETTFFTYDIVLGAWIVIAIAVGLYLLNLYRLPHDDTRPNVGVIQLLFALLFFGLGLYLTPALFKSADGDRPRPSGVVYAWVDAFLLPDASDKLPWRTDLAPAVEQIAKEKREGKTPEKPYIFVDFTGITCTNCAINEQNVFPQPEIRALLNKYELVQLYLDDVPANAYLSPPDREARSAEAAANRRFQSDVFKNIQRPLYAILAPQTSGKFKIIAIYDEGQINDVSAFTAFLKQPFEAK